MMLLLQVTPVRRDIQKLKILISAKCDFIDESHIKISIQTAHQAVKQS